MYQFVDLFFSVLQSHDDDELSAGDKRLAISRSTSFRP